MQGVSLHKLITYKMNEVYAPFLNQYAPSENKPDSFNTVNKNQQTKAKKNHWRLIAAVVGVSVIGMIGLMPMFSKGRANVLATITEKLKEIQTKLGNNKQLSTLDKAWKSSIEVLIRLSNLSFNIHQGCNNFLRKILNKTSPTKAMSDWCIRFFENIAQSSVKKKLKQTISIKHKAQEAITAFLTEVGEAAHIDKNKLSELRTKLNETLDNWIRGFDESIKTGQPSRLERLDKAINKTVSEYDTEYTGREGIKKYSDFYEMTHDVISRKVAKRVENTEIFKDEKKEIHNVEKTIEDITHKIKSLLTPVNTSNKEFQTKFSNVESVFKKLEDHIKEAVHLEQTEYKSRVIDLRLGHAFFEFTGFFTPFLFMGYEINKAKTNKQKESTAVRLGLPIVGGLGTAAFAISKCFNGPTSLIFGLGSGFILDNVAKYLDIKYIKNNKNSSKIKSAA